MYKKINSVNTGKEIRVGSILAQCYTPDDQGHLINRANAEHYQVHKLNERNQFELYAPDDEVPDVPIYINGKPVDGITYNEPECYRSIPDLLEENCWWLLKQ